MAKGFGAPKAGPKFTSRYGPKRTGFLKSAFGKPPTPPGPPKPKGVGKVGTPKFTKVSKI